MTHSVPAPLVAQLSEFVSTQMGLHFPPERSSDLLRGLGSAAKEFGYADAASCAEWLVASRLTRHQIEILASHLTVGETYFFREEKLFEILEAHVLPALIGARRGREQRLRFWSAGCCTGEEPYSLAITLSRLLPDYKDWNITIRATDINPRFLEKAAGGVYSTWSFRATPQWIQDRYFSKTAKGHFEIVPHIKAMVKFSYLNLAEDAFPSLLNDTNAMDIIFCRNVLMYFNTEQTRKVIDNFHRCLLDSGWMITSPSETSHILYAQFAPVNYPGAILYRKEKAGAEKKGRIGEWENGGQRNAGDADKAAASMNTLPLPAAPTLPSISTHPAPWTAPAPTPSLSSSPPLLVSPSPPPVVPVGNLYEEAQTLFGQGRYGEAADKLKAMLVHSQAHAQAAALLARSYANLGRLAEALEWCDKALAEDKLSAGSHYLRATIMLEQGTVEEAGQSLRRALYLDHDFVLAHFALGNLAAQSGKAPEAARHYGNALALLRGYQTDATLPESGGITAGRLTEIITTMTGKET